MITTASSTSPTPFPVAVIAILLPFTRVVNILAPFLPPRANEFVETRLLMSYGFVDGYRVCVRAVVDKDQTPPSLVFGSFKFPLSFYFKTKRCVLVNLINVYCVRNEDVSLLSSLVFIFGSL